MLQNASWKSQPLRYFLNQQIRLGFRQSEETTVFSCKQSLKNTLKSSARMPVTRISSLPCCNLLFQFWYQHNQLYNSNWLMKLPQVYLSKNNKISSKIQAWNVSIFHKRGDIYKQLQHLLSLWNHACFHLSGRG